MPKGHHQKLQGNYRVRALRSALREAGKLFPKLPDRMEIRSQALKLRYWGSSGNKALDLDCEWLEALKGKHVGELRINDNIAGFNNLRIVFYVDERKPVAENLPVIWILTVMQKKSNAFSQAFLTVFDKRRTIAKGIEL